MISPSRSGAARLNRRRFLLAGGAVCAALTGLPALAQPAPEAPGLRMARLRARVAQAEALRAVKRVQNAFAHYLTFGMWAEAAGLFAGDAFARARTGTALGREEIENLLRMTLGQGAEGIALGRLNVTLAMAPVVNVSAEGSRAQGRWRELAMLGEAGVSADWAGGIYQNEYVLEDGAWKIGFLNYYGRFAGPYDGGWRNTANGGEIVPFHYDARTAGTPLAAVSVDEGGPIQPGEIQGLQTRLRALIDEGQIQNLQNAYGFYVDRKMWDDVADLFAEGGVMQLGDAAAVSGKASIRSQLGGEPGLRTGQMNDHAQIGTVVIPGADGRSATARGFDLGMIGVNGQGGQWSVGVFENAYVKDGNVWKISSMRITPLFTADYAQGWAKGVIADHSAAIDAYAAPGAAADVAGYAVQDIAEDIDAALAETERLLAVAVAWDGAENVCNAYGYYIDEFQWDDTGELFAADGWKELSYVGAYQGRDRVRDSMKFRYGLGGRGSPGMTLHQKIQPVISVAEDGQSARVRERLFQMNSIPAAPGSYIGGVYENECVIENGIWKIAGMDLDYVWLGDYAGGWTNVDAAANARFAPAASFLEQMPPDRPLRGVTFAPFPEIAPLGFHYLNPVSGRAPDVLLPPDGAPL